MSTTNYAAAIAAVGQLGKELALSPTEAAAYALGYIQGSAAPPLEFWVSCCVAVSCDSTSIDITGVEHRCGVSSVTLAVNRALFHSHTTLV
jgi:hypothetical protein